MKIPDNKKAMSDAGTSDTGKPFCSFTRTSTSIVYPTWLSIASIHHDGSNEDLISGQPALIDQTTRLQGTNERELTACLCQNPYQVLKLAGGWLPEVAQREREFWKLTKKCLPPCLNHDQATQYLVLLCEENGYRRDLKKWESLYYDYVEWNFINSGNGTNSFQRALELFSEIKAFHEFRYHLEIIQRSFRIKHWGDHHV